MTIDDHLLVRATALYLAVSLTAAVWAWRRPTARALAGALLASIWNVPALLALHLGATAFGWWRVDAAGGLLLGLPVDVWLAWAWLWGAVPALAFPSLSLPAVIAIALIVDVAFMPAAAPVIQLGPQWLTGEVVGLTTALMPSQLLARWTARDEHLSARALLQMVLFAGLALFLLPVVVLDASGSTWFNPLRRPLWQLSLMGQLLAVPALLGVSAVHEFVVRGGGTPVPFDPPRRLVTTGVYAYVRNPMQLSAALLLLLIGTLVENVWIALAGVMAHIYSAGLAGWDEDNDLEQRFGRDWLAYRAAVRRWVPRVRPWLAPDQPDARLYVSSECGMCSEVGRWFAARGVRGLSIVAAESHPTRERTRIAYESDGYSVAGIEAVARALEHVHLGWALLGFAVRLPIVRAAIQLLVDASGGEPRPVNVRLPARNP